MSTLHNFHFSGGSNDHVVRKQQYRSEPTTTTTERPCRRRLDASPTVSRRSKLLIAFTGKHPTLFQNKDMIHNPLVLDTIISSVNTIYRNRIIVYGT